MRKWELSLLVGIAAALLFCAAPLRLAWWTTAFAPLCGDILPVAADGEEIVLRSKLWELLSRYVLDCEPAADVVE